MVRIRSLPRPISAEQNNGNLVQIDLVAILQVAIESIVGSYVIRHLSRMITEGRCDQFRKGGVGRSHLR